MVWLRTIVDNKVYESPTAYDSFAVLPWASMFTLGGSYSTVTANRTFTVYYYPSNSLTDGIMSNAGAYVDTGVFFFIFVI